DIGIIGKFHLAGDAALAARYGSAGAQRDERPQSCLGPRSPVVEIVATSPFSERHQRHRGGPLTHPSDIDRQRPRSSTVHRKHVILLSRMIGREVILRATVAI